MREPISPTAKLIQGIEDRMDEALHREDPGVAETILQGFWWMDKRSDTRHHQVLEKLDCIADNGRRPLFGSRKAKGAVGVGGMGVLASMVYSITEIVKVVAG